MFNRLILYASGAVLAGVMSQPATAQTAANPSKDPCSDFAWLIGTWDSYSPWGDQTKPTGGTLVFTIAADGSAEGRIGKLNAYMREIGLSAGTLVYRGFRDVRFYDPPGVAVYQAGWSGKGQSLDVTANGFEWREDFIGVRPTGHLYQSSSAHGDFAGPYRKAAGSGDVAQCRAKLAQATEPKSDRPGRDPAIAERANEPPSRLPVRDEEEKDKRCDQITYTRLLNQSGSGAIAEFETSTDAIAGGGTDSLPGAMLYPWPSSAELKERDFISAEDETLIGGLKGLIDQTINNRGPDDWLKAARRDVHFLHVVARDQYDGAGKRASDNFKPCPLYTEIRPHARLVEAEQRVAELRKRKSDYLLPQLARLDALNEKLTREFYGELSQANSLKAKAKEWALGEIESFMNEEQVAPEKTAALLPQLDALQDRYRKLEEAGTPVSDAQRRLDIDAALKKAGINYRAQSTQEIADEALTSARVKFTSFVMTQIVAKGAPAVVQRGAKVAGRAGFLLDVAEIVNGLKNVYSLWGVRQELMPTALSVQEARAYLMGLIERYDRVEADYIKLKTDFEKAVTESGAAAGKST